MTPTTTIGAVAWNVLVSAAFSFAAAALFVLLARRQRFADRRPRLAALFLALPFVKVAIELARGIPANAFFWARLDGAVQDKGSFQIGLGVDRFGPTLLVALGAVRGSVVTPQSGADVLAAGLDRRIGHGAASAFGFALGAIALVLVGRELVGLARSARVLRRHVEGGRLVETRRLLGRTVRIVVSPGWGGVPFAGGYFAPYVCIGASTWEATSDEERQAIILHELAHLRWFDAPLLVATRMLAHVLWFVPGSSRLARAIAAQIELAADADAVARGAEPAALASALVTAAMLAPPSASPLLAFSPLLGLGSDTTVARRVHRLLESESSSDDATSDAGARLRAQLPTIALLAFVTWIVLRMTACGNP